MKSTKLINILKTFSKEEIKQFEKFVASPFFTAGKNCMPLLKHLQKFYPGFDDEKLSNEWLYKKLYPGKKFNKQVMWNLTSALEKLLKDYLRQISLKKDKFEATGLLLSELGNRKLLNIYWHTLSEMEKLLEVSAIDYDYFDKRGHLENYKQGYYHMTDNIQPMSDSKVKASEYQIMLSLRMTVGGLNDMNVLSSNYNARFDVNLPLEFAKHIDLESIVGYARSKNFEYAFLIEIYYHALMTILIPQETPHFGKLRELYEIYYNRFTLSEKRTIMHWLVNYCFQKRQFNEIKYSRIIFELNDFRLKEGLAFYPENQIPGSIYFQILNIALEVKETKWAENFIKNYSSKLQSDIRESQKAMAYAILHFATREYEKVLKNLNDIEFDGIWDKLKARTLSAKTYYEISETESLLHYIDSSLHFLAKNPSLSDVVRKSYRNFFNSLRKIISIKENSDLDSIPLQRNEIEQIKGIESKIWLLEKLDELEKK